MMRNFSSYHASLGLVLLAAGCLSPADHRRKADEAARTIVAERYGEAMGRPATLDVERPRDILRRRLLLDQNLPTTGPASYGSADLPPVAHWPEPPADSGTPADMPSPAALTNLSLLDALGIGAQNSAAYQARKEDVFRSALALDLEQNAFRSIFSGQLRGQGRHDAAGEEATGGTVGSASGGLKKAMAGGAGIAAELALDLANLLTGGSASALGLAADTSVSIPLLRGAGRHIAAEPLTQAQRDVVYAIWEFEHYRAQYATDVIGRFFTLLRREDETRNSLENLRGARASAERSRRLADAGRVKEIEVDQAVQNELRARQRWIAAEESHRNALDGFKMLLGLPPDARLGFATDSVRLAPTDDAAREEDWAREEERLVRQALAQRLDLKVRQGKVYDAQRGVVVAADRLGAELTLLGEAQFGGRRSTPESATQESARLRADRGNFSGLLTLDLPIERTQERIAYRNRLIDLERATRAVQALEDEIKLAIRGALRNMRLARENVRIQTVATQLAEKRVRSVTLFLEAGRAQMRDLIEAQDALLAARNGLTSALADYRIAETELRRDAGTLRLDAQGLPDLALWHPPSTTESYEEKSKE
jgi:outer membrane protein TolC